VAVFATLHHVAKHGSTTVVAFRSEMHCLTNSFNWLDIIGSRTDIRMTTSYI